MQVLRKDAAHLPGKRFGPAEIAEKMVQGRIGKFYGEICLVDQEFVKDPDKKVAQLLKESGATLVAKDALDEFGLGGTGT